ncbi:hypothetical protein [Streptomyces sp. 2P-4]|uniref:hypothetical protein n=1 Tax=Streptomyces sp. 2P-4 TaxID=2931974 RepID=UPI002541D450|nr:hypothetical protein [Streptomyces sp. 2P-4]
MAHVYYRSPDSTSVRRSGGFFPPPEGWVEITAEEYAALLAEHRPPQPVNMGGLVRSASTAPKTRAAAKSKGK